jgi:hypothetical protein
MPHQQKQKHTTKKERKAAEEVQRKEAEAVLAAKRAQVEANVAKALAEREAATRKKAAEGEFEEEFCIVGKSDSNIVEESDSNAVKGSDLSNSTEQPVVVGKAGAASGGWGSWLWPFGGGADGHSDI